MKVYELMSLLEDEPAGADVKVDITITKKELEKGDNIDGEGLYALSLSVCSVEGGANNICLGTLAP